MTTITDPLHSIPVRLDIDAAVPAFTKALSHLDTTTTRELDRVGFPVALRELSGPGSRPFASDPRGRLGRCKACLPVNRVYCQTAGSSRR